MQIPVESSIPHGIEGWVDIKADLISHHRRRLLFTRTRALFVKAYRRWPPSKENIFAIPVLFSTTKRPVASETACLTRLAMEQVHTCEL
jgi:hypothetical protein